MIYLFNNNEKMIRIIPNSAIKRMYQTQTLTDENYISDRLDVEIQALNDEELSELEYMAIDDIENPQRFHYYFIVKETTEHQVTSLTGVQSGIEELRKTPVYDMRPTNLSPKLIADRLLEGTNWQAGYTTDDVGTISTNFYYTDVFSALKKMCMAFGIEMQFFVEITTNRIGARYIEFRKRTGKSVGKRVVYGHNALKIVKEVEKTNTVTALIGRGKGVQVSESDTGNIGYGRKIGFEDVEWKKSSGAPVDKPLGQEFVEIPELTLQYGIKNSNGTVRPKIGFVEFQDEESETRLIDRTYNALLELSRPQVLLETSSVYLPDTGIGDTINVVRHDRDLRYQTRVFEITWDRLANKAVDMKLGDRLGESENKRISRISDQVSGNISTELGSTIEELADRLTSADGKNTNWYTDYDPMTNPETMGLVRVNDNWYQPDPEYEGEFILKQWNGEMWVEILRTSGNPEVVRRVEEAMAEAEQAKEDAQNAYADSIAEAERLVDEQTRAFDTKFGEIEDSVDTFNQSVYDADAKAEAIKQGLGLDDPTLTNQQITDQIRQDFSSLKTTANNASQAFADLNNEYRTFLTDIFNPAFTTATSALSLAQQNEGLFYSANLIDEVTGQSNVYTKAEIDGTNGYVTKATFNANAESLSSEFARIEGVALASGANINLLITRNQMVNTWLDANPSSRTYPTPNDTTNTNATSPDLIPVTPGEKITLSKTTTPIDNYFRIDYLNASKQYVNRYSQNANVATITIPDNVAYLWVSYPLDSYPKIERGEVKTQWTLAPQDQVNQSTVNYLASKIEQTANYTKSAITNVTKDGLVTGSTINQTNDGLTERVARLDANGNVTYSNRDVKLDSIVSTVANDRYISNIIQSSDLVQSTIRENTNVDLLARAASGTSMTADPHFNKGINGLGVYDNASTNTISIYRNLNNDPNLPGGKGYRLNIYHASSTATDPHRGGIYLAVRSWANGTVVVRFTAKLDVGKRFIYAQSNLGTGWTGGWLTSNEGTGKWEQYAYYYRFGTSGAFQSFGFLAVDATSAAFTWYLSEFDIINLGMSSQSQITQLQDNINLKVSAGDLINQINISAGGTLIQSGTNKLNITPTTTYIEDATIKSAMIDTLNVSKLTGTVADFASLRSKVITADSITATHIKSDNALIDNIFATSALIERLTSKTAFINSIKAIEIDAGKITTGELNAANVKIVNLDVNNLSGNAMNFISGAFTSNAGSLLLSGNGLRVNFANGYNLRINGSGTNYYTIGGQPIGGLLTTIPRAGATHSLSLAARRGYTVSLDYQGSLSYNQSNRALEVDGTTGNITIERPIYESSGSAGLSFTRAQMGNIGWGLLLASTKATGSGLFLADNGEVWIGISGGYKQFA